METGGSADSAAIALTNGHCVQPWTANDVYFNLPADSTTVTFDRFVDAPKEGIRVAVEQVLYSTMKGLDLAVLELAQTIGELQAKGIEPLPIDPVTPKLPEQVTVVGIPVSGVPADLAYLRKETCSATGITDLFESQWHFSDSIRTSCQDIYGGSSGSPVFSADSTAVIGLVNTTTVGGVTACGLGMPCEVSAGGTTVVEDKTYVVPLSGLAGCFDDAGRFSHTGVNCLLDDGRQLLIANYPTQPVQPFQPDVDGVLRPTAWSAQLSGDRLFYRTKVGPAGAVDCAEDAGYGQPVAMANSQLVTGPAGPDDGSYLLCVVAGDTATVDESWQPVRHATAARIEIDSIAPTLKPALSVFDRGGTMSVEPIFVVPELVDFWIKVGPDDDTCEDPDGYSRYRRVPLNVPADRLPATVCVIASDMAGNQSEPHLYPLAFGGTD